MKEKDLNVLLLLGGILLLTISHPYLVSLGFITYYFNDQIDKEEFMATVKTIWNSWVRFKDYLNTLAIQKDITVPEVRQVMVNSSNLLFDNLSKEEIDELQLNKLLQNKVIDFIKKELQPVDYEWPELSLYEIDDEDEEDRDFINFITFFYPDFDIHKTYTYKIHRQLFKNIKAKFRNLDGSIKNEKYLNFVNEMESNLLFYINPHEYESPNLSQNYYDLLIDNYYQTIPIN